MDLNSSFIKLGVIFNDPFCFLLAVEGRRLKKDKAKKTFSFENVEAPHYKTDFRFYKEDIKRLKIALRVPDVIKVANGSEVNGLEALCMLRRMSYPNRLLDLQKVFGKSVPDMSLIFNHMINHVFVNFEDRLTSLDQWWLEPEHLQRYANAIQNKGAPFDNCVGFIDGTIHATCRPKYHHQEVYSGHKRKHGLKYQSIVIPNGLVANLYGPVSGRRHDSYMLDESRIMEEIQLRWGAPAVDHFHLYGDSGYPLKPHLITPYFGNALSAQRRQFNTTMSKMRICVEWEFGEIFEQFAFIDFSKNQKIFLQPLEKYMKVATLLKNCQTCLYGSQTTSYFGVTPPTLESYLDNNHAL